MPNKGRTDIIRRSQGDNRADGSDAAAEVAADETDDEAAAFVEAVRGARALGGAARVSPLAMAPTRPMPPPRGGGLRPPSAPAPASSGLKWAVSGGDESWSARADGVDSRTMRKLRAGDFPVDAEIDLHGLTRLRALAALERFLAASRGSGRRCVMVIHGRGLHSGEHGPALRDAVRSALTTGEQSVFVLACCPAPGARGGAGATLVLLRR